MRKRALLIGSLLLVAAGGAAAGVSLWPAERSDLPTVRVMRGTFDLSVHATGELQAGRSAMVAAPPVNGTLQIVRLAASGSRVKAGDVVVEFDPGEQEFALEQSRSELQQAEQELVRAKAEADVQVAQDRVALLKARFAIRRAELDLAGRELTPAIKVRKSELTLEEAQRSLVQLQQDLESKAKSSQAALAVLAAKRDKAALAMAVARQNIENMTLRSPMDGVVVLRQNQDAMGNMWISGVTLPDYRLGDMVSPGRLVADVLETNALELQTKIAEAERGNLDVGQAASVQVDGLPGGRYSASIRSISGGAQRTGYFDGSGRRFDVTLQLAAPDARLRPGLTAAVAITGQQLKNVLYLPRQALFEKNGKPTVYARGVAGFEARSVKVKHRSESRAVVEGLSEGTEVALVDPEAQAPAAGKPANGAAQGGAR